MKEHINKIPLIKYADRLFEDNSKYVVIACQHFLEPNANMLLSLVDRGFDSKKMYVIPKAYSYNAEIAKMLKDAGMKITRPYYLSDMPFDEIHHNNVMQTLSRAYDKYDKNIIIIDDGGEVLSQVIDRIRAKNQYKSMYVGGVEQTSAGYNKLKKKQTENNGELLLPVINTARSDGKLDLESPYIAELIDSRLENYLQNNKTGKQGDKYQSLILGAGAIGINLWKRLKDRHNVTLFDSKNGDYSVLESLLKNKDIVIGCTGYTSVPKEYHKHLRNKVLVNAASSDREFDAHYLRKECEKYSDGRTINAHKNYDLSKIGLEGSVLLNAGFPITFLGNIIEGSTDMMQITFGLLYAGVLSLTQNKYTNEFHQLTPEIEHKIVNKYKSLINKKG